MNNSDNVHIRNAQALLENQRNLTKRLDEVEATNRDLADKVVLLQSQNIKLTQDLAMFRGRIMGRGSTSGD